ncbi:MAG: M48 family metallopeptidase [Chitinophagaceae bacterium]|nr:M48 family metallopeptidase [Chitinophagaceae bacterium]
MKYIYPQSPSNIDIQKLQPSVQFKKQVMHVVFSIIVFFIVYILLILAAVGLAVGCVYAAGFIISSQISFLSISLAIGLLALGLSVCFFLIKFIFKVSKNENSSRIQITEADQPLLFDFIRKITEETKTPFPKKIFLSPDVNACVFYNSSFWSMILPVRKNLEIGIGLVNSVNISEFKAIMAHEFGHFSQQSMKLGSFTYNVNQVIFNLLYDNSSYSNFLSSWANIGNIVSFFAILTGKIAEAIQYILKEMYKVVNKSYMGLSREMEFHADALAASVSGGNNLISGLARVEVASGCYQTALNKADEWLKELKIAKNLFGNQSIVYKGVANEYNLPIKNNLPIISSSFIETFSNSRINYKDQWASHPSFADRKLYLEQLQMNVPPDETSAWVLFKNAEALQIEMTERIYEPVPYDRTLAAKYDDTFFENWYNNERNNYQLPTAYNGFYDKRYIAINDWNLEALSTETTSFNFETLFSPEHGKLYANIQSLQSDIDIVEAIKNKQIDVRSFDFAGTKYSFIEADVVIEQLKNEATQLENKLAELDKTAFCFFYNQAGAQKDIVKNLYLELQQQSLKNQEFESHCQEIIHTISPLYNDGNTFDFINATIATLKHTHEPTLKKLINQMLVDTSLTNFILSDSKEQLESFIQNDFHYYQNNEFKNNELDELNKIINISITILNEKKFDLFKKLLNEQLSVSAV